MNYLCLFILNHKRLFIIVNSLDINEQEGGTCSSGRLFHSTLSNSPGLTRSSIVDKSR